MFFVPETVESICVSICLRSNHKMTGLYRGRGVGQRIDGVDDTDDTDEDLKSYT